jgi:hypothetical protein
VNKVSRHAEEVFHVWNNKQTELMSVAAECKLKRYEGTEERNPKQLGGGGKKEKKALSAHGSVRETKEEKKEWKVQIVVVAIARSLQLMSE